MTALAPPEAREAAERELREALAQALFERGRRQGSVDPETWDAAGDEMQLWLIDHADALLAGPLAPVLADLDALRRKVAEADDASADLRIKLVETTEEADSTFDALCSASARAGRAEAERDALAEMAGEVAASRAEAEDFRVGSSRLMGKLILGRAEAEIQRDAATARATEAEARASRAEAALKRAALAMEGATVFVTSRERIKRPEGEDWWRGEIEAAGAVENSDAR